jgi:hypothetical protein
MTPRHPLVHQALADPKLEGVDSAFKFFTRKSIDDHNNITIV